MSRPFCSIDPRAGWSRRHWLATMLAAPSAASQEEELRRVLPPSSSRRDPALNAALDRIRTHVKKRDYRALAAMMSPTFRVEFDVGKGPQAFMKHWRPQSETSGLWDVMERMLALDGHFYSDTLCVVPYVVARFPLELDPLGHVVAVREDVDLLAKPEKESPKAGTLNHSIVGLGQPVEPPVVLPAGRYLEVVHPEAGRCYVASGDVYSPAGHRAFFEKRQGVWRWLSLAAATLADPPDLTHGPKRQSP